MRVFLSFTEPDFSEVLDSAFRSAGLEFEGARKADKPRATRSAAVRLHQFSERDRELPTSTLSVPLESYLENQDKSKPSRVGRTADPLSVAAELRITAQMTLSDLNRLRRNFALANHPDRAGSPDRENATRRMMVANMLIDREVNRRQPAAR